MEFELQILDYVLNVLRVYKESETVIRAFALYFCYIL